MKKSVLPCMRPAGFRLAGFALLEKRREIP